MTKYLNSLDDEHVVFWSKNEADAWGVHASLTEKFGDLFDVRPLQHPDFHRDGWAIWKSPELDIKDVGGWLSDFFGF